MLMCNSDQWRVQLDQLMLIQKEDAKDVVLVVYAVREKALEKKDSFRDG